jgi:transposase
MRGKAYRVHLTKDEKRRLEEVVSKGVHPARQVRRAHILLALHEEEGKPGRGQREIAARYGCTTRVVYMVSRQYAEEGIERVLNRKKRERPPVPAKVTGEIEAKIIAVSRSEPPAGYSRWTLRLLEERSKAVIGIELSDSTICGVLKRNTPEAASESVLVHTAQGERGVCGRHGGCA